MNIEKVANKYNLIRSGEHAFVWSRPVYCNAPKDCRTNERPILTVSSGADDLWWLTIEGEARQGGLGQVKMSVQGIDRLYKRFRDVEMRLVDSWRCLN